MKKFVLYVAVFGELDIFHIPKISIPDVDRFCYTDLDIKSDFYQIRKMELNHLDSIRRNRFIKICIPDKIFDNYEYSMYMDCRYRREKNENIEIDFEYLLNCMEPESDFLLEQHQARDCVYDEGLYCIKIKKDAKTNIMSQLDFYRSENYPIHNGLYSASWLFRRHTKKLKEFSKLWWEQIKKYSFRDQISLPYITQEYSMKISLWKNPK